LGLWISKRILVFEPLQSLAGGLGLSLCDVADNDLDRKRCEGRDAQANREIDAAGSAKNKNKGMMTKEPRLSTLARLASRGKRQSGDG
jgi:hypothetical protein